MCSLCKICVLIFPILEPEHCLGKICQLWVFVLWLTYVEDNCCSLFRKVTHVFMVLWASSWVDPWRMFSRVSINLEDFFHHYTYCRSMDTLWSFLVFVVWKDPWWLWISIKIYSITPCVGTTCRLHCCTIRYVVSLRSICEDLVVWTPFARERVGYLAVDYCINPKGSTINHKESIADLCTCAPANLLINESFMCCWELQNLAVIGRSHYLSYCYVR